MIVIICNFLIVLVVFRQFCKIQNAIAMNSVKGCSIWEWFVLSRNQKEKENEKKKKKNQIKFIQQSIKTIDQSIDWTIDRSAVGRATLLPDCPIAIISNLITIAIWSIWSIFTWMAEWF